MRVSCNMHQNHLPCLKKKSVYRQVIRDASQGGLGSTYRVLESANRGRTDMGAVMMLLYMIPFLAGCPTRRVVHGVEAFPQHGNARGTPSDAMLPNASAI